MTKDTVQNILDPYYHNALVHVGQAYLQKENLEQKLNVVCDQVAFAKRNLKDALRHAQALDGSFETVGEAMAKASGMSEAPHSSDEAL